VKSVLNFIADVLDFSFEAGLESAFR
jgi:hypothetical protein